MNIATISNCEPYVAEDKSVAIEFVGPRNRNLKNFSVAILQYQPEYLLKNITIY